MKREKDEWVIGEVVLSSNDVKKIENVIIKSGMVLPEDAKVIVNSWLGLIYNQLLFKEFVEKAISHLAENENIQCDEAAKKVKGILREACEQIHFREETLDNLN
ncbi:MAG TPA: hypothetical protein VGA67_00080 [Candidatus Dojkabacteria bacterium]